MAFIGMRHPVAATFSSHTPGNEPTYTGGKVIGHAIAGNLTINRASNPLYGDDVEIENDNGITGMALELGLDDLLEDDRVMLLGTTKKTTGSGQTAVDEYLDGDGAAPYVGIGYIRVRRKAGVTSFQAIWMYKVQFSENAENSATKGENIEWQTPSITGRAAALKIDSSNQSYFRKRRIFTNESDAISWLHGIANVPT